MILIAGTVPIKPDQREAARAACIAVQEGTRQEPGNHVYQFSFSTQDPDLMCLFEEWDDEASLQAHFATAHIAAFRAAFKDVVAGASTYTKYEVSSSAPLS
ncbi:MAG: hypothetical protein JWM12_2110 [Ilumatobacteraceae bacterium]|jgi:quinol monooxygenase YgiN|nr:hypothetical protein [Ilumatobacteraceae bacterium]